jgi:hypothetical protein
VKGWQALDSAGDVKRFLRWVILSLRKQALSRADAAVFSQLALALLKAMQDSDLEHRIRDLERAIEGTERGKADSQTTTH